MPWENRVQGEQAYLTRNADKQYPELDAFRGDGIEDLNRLAGALLIR